MRRRYVYCQIKSHIEAALPIKGVTYADLGELTQDHGKGIVISADACPLPVAADEEEEEEADSPASRAQVSLLGAALVGVASVALMLRHSRSMGLGALVLGGRAKYRGPVSCLSPIESV